MTSSSSSSGIALKNIKQLLPHEQTLLREGKLIDATHSGSSALWLEANSNSDNIDYATQVNVYRPMGDAELEYLVTNNQLPTTQPYQAIIEGESGREYAEKYLTGHKKVDTHPTTVVEFTLQREFFQQLYDIQHKIEDGVMSVGLGSKAGNGIEGFNEKLANKEIEWRIVKVKRVLKLKK